MRDAAGIRRPKTRDGFGSHNSPTSYEPCLLQPWNSKETGLARSGLLPSGARELLIEELLNANHLSGDCSLVRNGSKVTSMSLASNLGFMAGKKHRPKTESDRLIDLNRRPVCQLCTPFRKLTRCARIRRMPQRWIARAESENSQRGGK
jgi:hypothetical protein